MLTLGGLSRRPLWWCACFVKVFLDTFCHVGCLKRRGCSFVSLSRRVLRKGWRRAFAVMYGVLHYCTIVNVQIQRLLRVGYCCLSVMMVFGLTLVCPLARLTICNARAAYSSIWRVLSGNRYMICLSRGLNHGVVADGSNAVQNPCYGAVWSPDGCHAPKLMVRFLHTHCKSHEFDTPASSRHHFDVTFLHCSP